MIKRSTGEHIARKTATASSGFAMAVLLLSCGLIGCGTNTDSATSSPNTTDSNSIQVKAERGPLSAIVNVSPKEPRLSDLLTLTLTVTAASDIEVKLPEFQSAFEELIVRDFQDPLPTVAKNQTTLKQIYKLEPLAAGQLAIPAFTIRYKVKETDRQPAGDGDKDFSELKTDELKLRIETVVDIENLSLDAMKPAATPIALPKPVEPFPWLRWLVAAASILAVATVAWIRSQKVRPEDMPSPNEVATKELDLLVSDKSAREDLRNFYVQLTGIVRRYIEAVTGVQAAEQTTEEFLVEMQDKRLFSDSSNQRLQDFLETSDLIKFAGQTPDSQAVADSILAARQFIQLPPINEASTTQSGVPSSNR